MALRTRKHIVLDSSGYPSKKVQAKFTKAVLGDEKAKLLTRTDLAALVKGDTFAKAPKTLQFTKELRAHAKNKGAYRILVNS